MQSIDGSVVPLWILEDSTLLDLKLKIEDLSVIPVSVQVLWLRNKKSTIGSLS